MGGSGTVSKKNVPRNKLFYDVADMLALVRATLVKSAR